MNEREISVLEEFLFDMFDPAKNWPDYYFKQRSYSKWAINELLERIKEQPLPPIVIVEDFIQKMEEFSCLNKETKLIFSVARDVAKDVHEVFRAMY